MSRRDTHHREVVQALITLQRTFVVYPGAQRGSWSMG